MARSRLRAAGGIAVLAAHPGDTRGHPVAQLAHLRCADRGKELVPVSELQVSGIGHHAHDPSRFTEHYRVGTSGSGQLQPCGDQAVAHAASRTSPPPCLIYLAC
jgi:hypothetical protein